MDVNNTAASGSYQPIMPAMTGQTKAVDAPAPILENQGQPDVRVSEKPAAVAQHENASDKNVAEAVAAERRKDEVSNEYLEKTINQVNKSLNSFNRELQINVHKKTGRIMVKVMDTGENRVIREIPPEKVLDAFARTLEMAGILVDKKR